MNDDHYVNKVWPLTFYISRKRTSKWQMNAARALGNLGDRDNIPALIGALNDSPHDIVRGMSAWALGRLGSNRAKEALEARMSREEGPVKQEIQQALEALK
jgi:epoxyqueuosine reductase